MRSALPFLTVIGGAAGALVGPDRRGRHLMRSALAFLTVIGGAAGALVGLTVVGGT